MQNAVFNFGIPEGAPGTPGTNGQNAYTTTTLAGLGITVPSPFSPILLTVDSTDWMFQGQVIWLEGLGYFTVNQVVSSTTFIMGNPQLANTSGSYPTNVAPGTPIPLGTGVSPGGLQGPNGLDAIVLTGNGAPNTIPLPNPGGQDAIYLDQTGNWWTWDGSGPGPWVDTGTPVTGPPGPPGIQGHTPVLTSSTGSPTGGQNGDWHIERVNTGRWQVWSKASNVWNPQTFGTLVANRILGSGTVDPNTINPPLAANTGDLWLTDNGTQAAFWQYNQNTLPQWDDVIVWSTAGGGGGGGSLSDAANASLFVINGRDMGNSVWMMRQNIQAIPQSITVTTNTTVTLNTNFSHYIITLNGTNINLTLDYVTVPNGTQRFPIPMTIEIVGPPSAFSNISYAPNKWTKNPSITHPVVIGIGDRLSMRCEYLDGRLNIIGVSQNYTII
jgi:hypothetical protein